MMRRSVEPRPLSPDERSVLDLLLTAEFPGRVELRAQLNGVQVIGVCECGCGTVHLRVLDSAPRADCREPIPVEAQGKGLDVLLFVRGGRLSSLEIVDHGNTRPLPYPQPTDLWLWVPSSARSTQR